MSHELSRQFALAERPRQVFIEATLAAEPAVLFCRVRGHRDDRDTPFGVLPFMAPNLRRRLETIHLQPR